MKKGTLLSMLVVALLVTPCENVNAEETVEPRTGNHSYLDNDEANTPNGVNSWTGMWDYLTGSRHYRGDARIQRTTTGTVYIWGWKTSTGPYATNPEVYVYLNDAKFNCSKANYQYYAGSNQALCLRRMINQNVAPVGWGYLGTASTGGSKRMHHLALTSMVKESGYMGADGMRITY